MREPLEKLAERVRSGISKSGSFLAVKEDLAVLWTSCVTDTEEEKQLRVLNFARHYGFEVRLVGTASVAMFHNAS